MIGHIKTVAVYVEDQARSLEFYTGKLGFELRRNQSMGPGGSWIEVAPPGAQTCLVLYPRGLMTDWAERKGSIVFACEDAERTCAALSAKGVAIAEPARRMKWGTYAKFLDPDGNEFLVVSS